MPPLEFNGGNPTDLKVTLMFDTYETGDDVRDSYTNALWEMAMVNKAKIDPKTKKGQPPQCEFRWGTMWSFKAVIANITQKFTLFLADGTAKFFASIGFAAWLAYPVIAFELLAAVMLILGVYSRWVAVVAAIAGG